MNLLFVILEHQNHSALRDLVGNLNVFCPDDRIMLYNSGTDASLGADLDIEHFPNPRVFLYARIAGFFLHLFEHLIASGDTFDAVVNLETDMAFIRPGYRNFIARALQQGDYLAPNLVRERRLDAYWRPLRSLRPEFETWFDFFGFRHWHGSFSPAQVFSRRYVETLVAHPRYDELRQLVQANRSFTLQEVLYPTLCDFLGLRLEGYPVAHTTSNRYRPYQAVSGVKRALAIEDAYFVHPVRRDPNDAGFRYIRELENDERQRV